jgi:Glycosyl transferase family 11
MNIVYPKLPHAGLGNMLIVWARARLFAHLNNLPIVEPNWNIPHIGPWLRGERDKRFYGGLFQSAGYLRRNDLLLHSLFRKKQFFYNPPINVLSSNSLDSKVGGNRLFVFNELPGFTLESFDYFQDLKEADQFIREELFGMIKVNHFESINSRPVPQIGIHIRMGDFMPETEFNNSPISRTSIAWFINVLQEIRSVIGSDIPATIFTDGYRDKLKDILTMPNVMLSPPSSSALSDMVTLSRSRVILASSHSTFSSWGTYLGQCPTVRAPRDGCVYGGAIASKNVDTVYEGEYDPGCMAMPKILFKNLKSRFSNSAYSLEI